MINNYHQERMSYVETFFQKKMKKEKEKEKDRWHDN